MTALIIPNGITLSTLHTRVSLNEINSQSNEMNIFLFKHVYASFLKRDDAYNKICKVWKNCIADKVK